jgi:uncharacterized membrane protein HdeD (DUF308 family)
VALTFRWVLIETGRRTVALRAARSVWKAKFLEVCLLTTVGYIRDPVPRQEISVIILGIILLIIGFVAHIAILWTIGIIVLVVGLILALLGGVGHAVGGRRHYW